MLKLHCEKIKLCATLKLIKKYNMTATMLYIACFLILASVATYSTCTSKRKV